VITSVKVKGSAAAVVAARLVSSPMESEHCGTF
jgi:hypothetical protein